MVLNLYYYPDDGDDENDENEHLGEAESELVGSDRHKRLGSPGQLVVGQVVV